MTGKERKKKHAWKYTLVVALISGILLGGIFLETLIPEEHRSWHIIQTGLAEANPGSGASGILGIYFWKHSSTPTTTYATNLSDTSADCYGYADTDDFNVDIPHDEAFDIVVKARFNTTHAYDSSTSTWKLEWVRARINSTGLDIGPNNVTMEEVQITSNSQYMWVNFYIQDSDGGAGNGFTISRDETAAIEHILLEWYG